MKSFESETKRRGKKITRLFRGQTVTIHYDDKFRRQYPNLTALYHGKTGMIVGFVGEAGESVINVKLFDRETLVERSHILEAR